MDRVMDIEELILELAKKASRIGGIIELDWVIVIQTCCRGKEFA